MDKPKVLVIVGPTACGKSALAIQMAKQYHGEIIAADSRTIYRGMDIGTAKPTAKEQQGIPHFGFDLVTPDQTYSVKEFQVYALQKIQEILERGHLPILVGGTGLYISSVLDAYPFTDIRVDEVLRASLNARSLDSLVSELQQKDPKTASGIDVKNKRRVQRALEYFLQTGTSFIDQHQKKESLYKFICIGIKREKELLKKNITKRVEEMCNQGLEGEVRSLVKQYGWEVPGLAAIAYQEWRGFFEGIKSLSDVKAEIIRDNEKYAKRQMTWFKRDKRIVWFEDTKKAEASIKSLGDF